MSPASFRGLQPKVKHLIEIAIIKIAAPVYTDEVATHDVFQVCGLVGRAQGRHIALELALGHEGAAKARNGHVGQRQQPIKDDAIVRAQVLLVRAL